MPDLTTLKDFATLPAQALFLLAVIVLWRRLETLTTQHREDFKALALEKTELVNKYESVLVEVTKAIVTATSVMNK